MPLLAISVVQGNDHLTPQELLRRSDEAMQPPIRYTMTVDGSSADVTQGIMGNGEYVLRIETNDPIREVTIQAGTDGYEVYPDHGVIVDLSAIDAEVLQIASSTDATAHEQDGDDDSTPAPVIGEDVTHEGRQCYQLETLITATPPSPNGDDLPHSTVQIIDRETYEILAVRTLSPTGRLLSEILYSKIDHAPEIMDEEFLPPDGMEVRTPQSDDEHAELLLSLVDLDYRLTVAEALQQSEEAETDAQLHAEAITREADQITAESRVETERIIAEAREIALLSGTTSGRESSVRLGAQTSRRRKVLLFNIAFLAIFATIVVGATYMRRRQTQGSR